MEPSIIEISIFILFLILLAFGGYKYVKSLRMDFSEYEAKAEARSLLQKFPTPDEAADAIEEKLKALVGQRIRSVYYLFVNEIEDFDLGAIHQLDLATSFEFENGEWLTWVWEEEIYYDETTSKPTGFYLYFSPIDEFIEKDSRMIEVTNFPNWQKLIEAPISEIIFHYNEDRFTVSCSDLVLKNNYASATLCTTEEPTPGVPASEIPLPVTNEWTVVVFDEKIVKRFNRGEYR